MAGRNDDNSNNLPGDFLKSRKSNNTRPTRSSSTKSSKETDDTLKDLDLTSRKVKEVNEQKLKSEKKITEEKQKQVKLDSEIAKSSKNQIDNAAKMLQNSQSSNKNRKEEIGYLKEIATTQRAMLEMTREKGRQEKDSIKSEKEKVSSIKDEFDARVKGYNEQKNYEKQLSEMTKKHASYKNEDLKKYQSAMIGLWKQQQQNLRNQADVQKALNDGYFKSADEAFKRYEELDKQQEEFSKKQAEINKKIEQAQNLQDKKTGLKNNALQKLGVNTNSDIFKYFSADKTKLSADQKSFMKSSAKLEAASAALEVTSKAIGTVLKNWFNRFTSGINNIYNTYEQTYTKIASVMDTNQKSYHEWQNNVSKDLQDQGLNSAVTVSQAMSELERLASDGFTDMTKASQMSIQNIQNKIINPFVNTASDAYEDLQYQFGTKFTKQITGMSGYLSDISGSNRVFKGSIDKVIETLEPVALASKKEMLSGKEYAAIESAVNRGKMTWSQGVSLISDVTDTVANPDQALMSGNVAKMSAVANGSYLKGTEAVLESFLNTAKLAQSSNPIAQGVASTGLGTRDYFSPYADIDDASKTIVEVMKNTTGSGTSPLSYYDKQLSKLKNGQLTTETQQKANIAENASTFVATLREAFPDAYDSIVSIASTVKEILAAIIGGAILKGIGGMAGKSGMLSGVAGKVGSGLSSAGTYLGSGLANGFSNAAPTALGAGKIGAFTGTAGAVAGAAGAVAGGAMAIKGTTDVIKDFKSGDVNAGTAMSATGAVAGAGGTAALLALGASNPIGWAALAVGGIALASRAIYNDVKENKELSASQLEKWNKEVDNEVKEREAEQSKQMTSLKVLRKQIDKTSDVDEIKNKLISAGIATQKELNDSQYDSKEALLKLTDTYIESADRLNKTSNQVYSELKKSQNGNFDKYVQSAKGWMEEVVKRSRSKENVSTK